MFLVVLKLVAVKVQPQNIIPFAIHGFVFSDSVTPECSIMFLGSPSHLHKEALHVCTSLEILKRKPFHIWASYAIQVLME